MSGPAEVVPWDDRASAAESAVVAGYVRRVAGLPGTALGRPRPVGDRRDGRRAGWNYWWQAHLIDCLVDAQQRAPTDTRQRLTARVVRSVWLRNGGWCNSYHDDMAWLALALSRLDQVSARAHTRARSMLLSHLRAAREAGIVAWRCRDDFLNAPANAPLAVLLAREGDVGAASMIVGWLQATLVDPATGLVIDGVRRDGRRESTLYTYNQGTALGALVEISRVDPNPAWAEHAVDLVDAIRAGLTRDGVLVADGGGDGALFAGICARYLGLAARRLGLDTAADIVLASARAAWDGRDPATGRFAADWSRRADGERDDDLSAQLSAWMTLEAAAALTRRPPTPG